MPAVLLDMETTDSSEAAGVTKAQPERIVDHSPNMEIQIRTQGMYCQITMCSSWAKWTWPPFCTCKHCSL